jgi:hypothetical protein
MQSASARRLARHARHLGGHVVYLEGMIVIILH